MTLQKQNWNHKEIKKRWKLSVLAVTQMRLCCLDNCVKILKTDILDNFLNEFYTWLYMKKKRMIVLENTKMRMLGLEREKIKTNRRKLQDAEISNWNRYHILSGWKSNGRQNVQAIRMEEVAFWNLLHKALESTQTHAGPRVIATHFFVLELIFPNCKWKIGILLQINKRS